MILMSGNVFAGSTETDPFAGKNEIKPIIYTECLGGHLFAIAASQQGVTMMQIFKDAGDMVPKPIECPPKEYDDE